MKNILVPESSIYNSVYPFLLPKLIHAKALAPKYLDPSHRKFSSYRITLSSVIPNCSLHSTITNPGCHLISNAFHKYQSTPSTSNDNTSKSSCIPAAESESN